MRVAILPGLVLALALVPFAAAEPYGIHTSIAPGGVAVTWFDDLAVSETAWVAYGNTTDLGTNITASRDATVPQYKAVYTATVPARAGEPFHYRVVSPGGESDMFQARAPPARDAPVGFVAFADHGYEAVESRWMIEAVENVSADLTLVIGDLSYAEGRSAGWDDWFRLIEPIAAQRPFMVAFGNHDKEGTPVPTQDDSTLYQQYEGRFVLPGDEFNYVFTAGPVAFVIMDSEDMCVNALATRNVPSYSSGFCRAGEPANPVALERLETLLAEATATNARWIVVAHHRPVYSHGNYGEHEVAVANWVPLYEKYGVDLVLAGHDHVYVRTHPLLGGAVVDTGPGPFAEGAPIYVVTGGGGRSLYTLTDAPAWSARSEAVFHYTHVTADEDRIIVEARRLMDRSILDRFVIGAAEPDATTTPSGDQPDASTPAPGALGVLLVVAIAGRAVGRAARRPGRADP